MPDHWKILIDHIPFLAMTAPPRPPQINTQRIVEALLIAGLTALVTSTLTADRVSTRLEERVAGMIHRIERCETELARFGAEHSSMRERLAACEFRNQR